VQWTPTGNNVPDYPKLAQLWWQNIGDASSGAKTPQAAMDALAAAQDSVLERLERANVQGECGPKMNKKESAEAWFKKSEQAGNVAPARKLQNEKPKGETVDYDTLIKSWPASPPKRS
jgi:glycerol transport system substrate-binding protein